jgi:ketosteroid isomerase-like protein
MKRIIQICVFLLSSVCFISQAQSLGSQPASRTPADTEVLSAVDRFYDAFLAGDVETVKRMTADDYLQTDVNGRIQNKLAWLAEYYMPIVEHMKAGQFRWEVFERRDIQVRRYGDVAVLIGVTKLKNSNPTTPPNAAKPRELRFT